MKLLLFVLFLGITTYTQAQTEGWATYATQEGVSIQIKKTDCIRPSQGTAKQYYLLRIVNDNSHAVKISFLKQTDYGNGVNSSSSEHLVQLELGPEEQEAGTCTSTKQLKIFSKMLDLENVRQLQNFELKNISVEKI